MVAPVNRVLLINANNNVALTIARALGRQGVPVDGVGWPDGGVGLRSRYVGRRYWINGYKELTPRRLRQILAETKAAFIMAMGEDVLSHLNSMRDSIAEEAKCLFPEQQILDRAFDKSLTLRIARQVGIDCPRTLEVDSTTNLADLATPLQYPLVLKFAHSHNSSLPSNLRFSHRIVQHENQLKQVLSCCSQYNAFPMIQEYIPGKGLGIEVCMSPKGVAAAFQHERIHEFPLSGGPSVYRKSVPLSRNLMEQSVALLRAMEWEGVAMVEYRRDPLTNRTVLMEVNGRFWGSLPLAVKAGINFPYILYETMGEGKSWTQDSYRIDVKVKQTGPHLRWFWQAFVTRNELPPKGFMPRWRVLWEFLLSHDPRVAFDIEEWDDPIPGIYHWFTRLASSMGIEWKGR